MASRREYQSLYSTARLRRGCVSGCCSAQRLFSPVAESSIALQRVESGTTDDAVAMAATSA
jgi:hypothetical protein